MLGSGGVVYPPRHFYFTFEVPTSTPMKGNRVDKQHDGPLHEFDEDYFDFDD
jgi:hypothetical protein